MYLGPETSVGILCGLVTLQVSGSWLPVPPPHAVGSSGCGACPLPLLSYVGNIIKGIYVPLPDFITFLDFRLESASYRKMVR